MIDDNCWMLKRDDQTAKPQKKSTTKEQVNKKTQ